MRVALSHYVTNGISCALGLLLVSALAHWLLGAQAAAGVTVGTICASLPDLPAPRRGKFMQMLPATLIGTPLFFSVQLLHDSPAHVAMLLVPMTFVAFLTIAWGKRGIPIALSIMFSMIFSMATRAPGDFGDAADRTAEFAFGALGYVAHAVLTNLVLNARYRVLMLADLLLSVAELMRAQAAMFAPIDPTADLRSTSFNGNEIRGRLLKQHCALSDQMQSARDIVLESPRTLFRQRLASMLIVVLDVRDMLLASELDVAQLRRNASQDELLREAMATFLQIALELEQLADSLLLGRRPSLPDDLQSSLQRLHLVDGPWTRLIDQTPGPTPSQLARSVANRVGRIDSATRTLFELARRERKPDLAAVRHAWQMFVSPTEWSLKPFLSVWAWHAPTMRHAVRASLAVAAGYGISQLLPWASHPYWILLTIVVVLRGSFAQTLERRDLRVAGTLVGCVLTTGLLVLQPAQLLLLIVITVAQGTAHAFAVRRYLITSVAATVLGLLQAHLLQTGGGTVINLMERLVDTLLGAGLAWGFSYVLPSWERGRLATAVIRTLQAQSRHASLTLQVEDTASHDDGVDPDLRWRLSRQEAYSSLFDLVQSTQRSLVEPRAVRPPLMPLEQLQSSAYQLIAQLGLVRSMLLMRRDGLRDPERIEAMVDQTQRRIEAVLDMRTPRTDRSEGARSMQPTPMHDKPDRFESDVMPWLERRLTMSETLAQQMRRSADRALARLPKAR